MAKKNLKMLDTTAVTLTAIGGVNWGLEALNLNVVDALANAVNMPVLATAVYSVVGIASVWFGVRALMGAIKLR